jgi:hypothetical protein
MRSDRLLAVLAAVVGLALIVVGVIYIAQTSTTSRRSSRSRLASLEPSPREARDRRDPARPRLPRVRVVPHRAAGASGALAVVLVLAASRPTPDHVLPGDRDRAAAGVTELFPISSLGHAVILPKLFGWNLNQKEPYYLAFLVATHLATAIVLFLFFLREWLRILRGLGRSLRDRQWRRTTRTPRSPGSWSSGRSRPASSDCSSSIQLRSLFANPTAAAAFLMVTA